MYVPCDTAAGSPFGIVFVLPEDTTPFNCEGTYHFRGRGRGMIYIRAMAARKTCPPSSSPEKRASGLPPPVGRGCRAAATVMSDVVAVEQSFLSSLASKGLFFCCSCCMWLHCCSGFSRCISNRESNIPFFPSSESYN